MIKAVNFEIAKLLKEKGFHQHHEFSEGYTKNGDLFHQGYGDLNKTQDYFQAPTIAEVVMWLYEKYGIWISLDAGFQGFYGHYKINPIETLPSNLKQGWVNLKNDPIKTPTEAYEAAIKYTLENLI